MGGTCSMHVGNEKCVKIYSENRTRIDSNVVVDGKVYYKVSQMNIV